MAEDKDPGTALVTGAGRRLGRAIALDLARASWRVGVHCRASEAEAKDLVAEIERGGGHAAPLVADLAQTDSLAPLVEACADRLGPPTLLLNNAARFEWDSIATLDEASWDAHLDVNLRAPVFLAQAFAEALPQDHKGHIINLLDQKVFRLNPDFFSYTISKSGLLAATTMLAQALGPRIRVNAIAPGPVLPSAAQSAAAFEAECRTTLLGHCVGVEEILGAVRFLLAAPSVTGETIVLDSGQRLTP
jgi:NAD(P)-dependent dehydrogenase (short-subunit alcohol dehydrogenase family)